ncbi:hypothetical protein BDA96_04G047700 [Sorghum bicolor]|uniref:Uncharacterized protein n=2 Tax=Sorghum bicolor TaxID=4558 RepID=A0A921R3G8_SORBI|nr:hypothetical protein BDA96_04G047700 [Sorghum bicolor]OQU84384.1 hypothetical protein SORBI_3004G043101 [Sorghum bicolor]
MRPPRRQRDHFSGRQQSRRPRRTSSAAAWACSSTSSDEIQAESWTRRARTKTLQCCRQCIRQYACQVCLTTC